MRQFERKSQAQFYFSAKQPELSKTYIFAMRDIILPVINLSSSHMADPAARAEETAKLMECFSNAGFCFVSGLEGYNADKLLKWIKWFYLEVSEEERMGQLATKTFVKVI
jgi:hypothetical protein